MHLLRRYTRFLLSIGFSLLAGCAEIPGGNRYVNDRGDVWPESQADKGPRQNAPLDSKTPVVSGRATPLVAVTGTHVYHGPNQPMLMLSLEVLDHDIDPGAGINRVWVRRMLDDRGREMSLDSPEDGVWWSVARDNIAMRMPGRVGDTPLRRVTLRVSQPDDKVRSFRSIEGMLEFFDPTDESAAVVRIPAAPTPVGAAIDPRLAKWNIEISMLDQPGVMRRGRMVADSLGINPPNFVIGERCRVFYVKDPSIAILGFELQDASGRPLVGQNSDGFGPAAFGGLASVTTYYAIPAGAQLAIFLREPGALKARPFHVENVALH